jgi:4-hydroxy-3-methylbut-2-enyl diphosphate reductase
MELILAEPRGFCAGVRRAILIVEKAIEKFGIPIYVKHEIVHNKIVIESLKSKGVIFTDDLSIIPKGSVVIYSAHGVSDKIEEQASELRLLPLDATCPLVKKVHKEVVQYDDESFQVILIGHKNHPEIEGTSGKLKKGRAIIIESVEDAKNVVIENQEKLAIATQTTLSIDDTREIIEVLESRFSSLKGNIKNDICYATQNRQTAVRDLIEKYEIDGLIVVGSQNSSNSNRLKDIGLQRNIISFLVNEPKELNLEDISNLKKIGITAGASAPEHLIEELIEFFKKTNSDLKITIMNGVKEDTIFHLPKQLRD